MRAAALVLILVPWAGVAQTDARTPIASRPAIEVRGRISRVAVGFAQGMPSLDVVAEGRTWKIWLGSMRYLLENDFNPKAGQRVTVIGFPASEQSAELFAARIILLDGSRRTLRLRDENGWPLWRRGVGPGRRGRGPGRPF